MFFNNPKINLHTPTERPSTRFGERPLYQEGLYDLGFNVSAWLVPNGSWGESNAGLICSKNESLLIDTLWDLNHTQTMLDAMQPIISENPIQYLVNTHADGDHFWGNQLVDTATIISTNACYREMKTVKPISLKLFAKTGKLLSFMSVCNTQKIGHWFQQMLRPYDFNGIVPTLPTEMFSGNKTLVVGDREVHLIQVGPAHTDGDLIVYIPDAKILFCGDILFAGSTPVMWSGPVEHWIETLEMILDMNVDIIIPGHGPATDKKSVALVKDYFMLIRSMAHQKWKDNISPARAASQIAADPVFSESIFIHWNSPERLMTNVHTLYRHFNKNQRQPSIPKLVTIMMKQALLAHELPNAQPTSMRLYETS